MKIAIEESKTEADRSVNMATTTIIIAAVIVDKDENIRRWILIIGPVAYGRINVRGPLLSIKSVQEPLCFMLTAVQFSVCRIYNLCVCVCALLVVWLMKKSKGGGTGVAKGERAFDHNVQGEHDRTV